jgi:ectoine hydroxylase-related dioxygenase (phytanoyl-CoA dioxygenase family)
LSDSSELSDEQWSTLLRDGIVKVPGAYSDDLVQKMRQAIEAFYRSNPNGNDEKTNLPSDSKRSDGLIMFLHMPVHNPIFQEIVENPLAYSTLERLLGPGFYLSDFSMRKVSPGARRMPFHKDNHGGISMLILTDDIGEDEGATAYIPGSHINSPSPQYCMSDTLARHPDEIQTTGKAGDLYFFFLDGWHARSVNNSNRYTGIMLPDFRNRNSEPQPFLRSHIEGIGFREPVTRMLRNYEPEDRQELSWIERIAFRGNYSEQFFSEMLYYWAAYGRKKKVRAELPGQTTAAIHSLHVPISLYFKRLDIKITTRAAMLHLMRKIPGGRRTIEWIKRQSRS